MVIHLRLKINFSSLYLMPGTLNLLAGLIGLWNMKTEVLCTLKNALPADGEDVSFGQFLRGVLISRTKRFVSITNKGENNE